MATSIQGRINALLFGRLNSIILSPALPVAWKDMPFAPPATAYLIAHVATNQPRDDFRTAGEPALHRGIFSVALMYPKGGGMSAPTDVAWEIASYFPRGLHLWDGDLKVTISKTPHLPGAIIEETRTRHPVIINWMSYS